MREVSRVYIFFYIFFNNILIGNTGFIGSSLNQEQYHLKINSKNWDSISEPIDVDKLVIAAPSGVKYLANKDPLSDLDNCISLASNIIKCFNVIKSKHTM